MSIFDEKVTICLFPSDPEVGPNVRILAEPLQPFGYQQYAPIQYTTTVAELLEKLLKSFDVTITPAVPRVDAKLELIRREP